MYFEFLQMLTSAKCHECIQSNTHTLIDKNNMEIGVLESIGLAAAN
jgi:hypothetical protein